jgi:carboxypeptidase Taq
MRDLVGIVPPDDRDGCLQDIHWYAGLFGYFPTYTLGALTAAQLFQAACAADSMLRPAIAAGDFKPLLGWLRQNIHGRASSATAREIVQEATGKPLSVEAYRGHLQRRYLASA